jgi:hypothetical protein
MILHDSKTKLTYAARKLQLRWNETQTQWNDAVSADLERKWLAPLDPKVAATVRAIDALAEVLNRAEAECR